MVSIYNLKTIIKMKKIFSNLLLGIITLFVITSCNPDETLYNTAAKPLFDASSTTIELGEPIQFTDKSVPTNNTKIVGWKWNFDSENADNTTEVSIEQNPVYTFKKVGRFVVRLTVKDNNGRTANVTKSIEVKVPYDAMAHAKFSVAAEKVAMNSPVQFTDESLPAKDATIATWEWNFGENEKSISNIQNPKWTYTTSGSFTVKLKIKDTKGNESEITKDLVVIDPMDLVVVKWRTPLQGSINNTVSPAMSNDGTVAYMWANSLNSAYNCALKAYNVSTGAVVWSFDASAALSKVNDNGGVRQVFISPSVGSNGDIYIGARDLKNSGAARKSVVFAVSNNGSEKWHYALGLDGNFNYETLPIDAAGNIYVGHLTNTPFQVAKLNPITGIATPIATGIAVRSGMSLDKNGNIYFCSTGSEGLYSYTQSSAMNWQYNTDFATTGADITIGSDGTVYTVAEGKDCGIIVAVASNGKSKWSYKTANSTQFGGVVLGVDGTVYATGGKVNIGAKSAGVYAINANGTLKWHFDTDEDVNNCVPLVDNRGYVHFITDKGTYYVVTGNGTLYGKKNIGSKSYASPVMNASGVVCVAAEDADGNSFMFGIDTGATGFAQSAWPMKGQNPQRTHLQK